ncbi:hypothetical protein [Streptomyces roseolus]|uniref:hypothetical protein n=1 Tax=Streptomyces roseolus TaxID=67358 RepID=UPI0036675C73
MRAEAKQDFVRLLSIGAVVVAGPLLALWRRLSGVTQLVILGGSAIAACSWRPTAPDPSTERGVPEEEHPR